MRRHRSRRQAELFGPQEPSSEIEATRQLKQDVLAVLADLLREAAGVSSSTPQAEEESHERSAE
jgi:hypothetical protein